MRLSGVGVWSSQLRYGAPAESAEAAAELEELGFTALWIPDVGGAVFDAVENLLAATTRTVIATGILNLWMHTPEDVATSYARLTGAHGDRFLLGIGVSHAPLTVIPSSTAMVWAVTRGAQLISLLPAPLTRAVAKLNAKGMRMHDSMRVKDYTSMPV